MYCNLHESTRYLPPFMAGVVVDITTGIRAKVVVPSGTTGLAPGHHVMDSLAFYGLMGSEETVSK